MMSQRRQSRYLPYLTAWRGEKFWTQEELHQHSGVSKSTVQYLEDDKQPHPANGSTIRKLAEALSLLPETLLHVDPQPLTPAEIAAHFEAGKSFYATQENKASV